ncbi:adhesion G protein-coupled receptor E3-like [Tachysurus vachellii]|uniref:adhesion G protein-coupled receptor E3-like n=1 Tax=Tachysurus vachellii TaxID=175792 RepID=UPI00296B51DA|nr:adhesion G protein-coupled receptor E3-like [Tachysurus vachellii]
MNWKTNTWNTCSIIQTNNTHTVCSCQSMTTLAVISQTDPCKFNLTVQCAKQFLEQIQYNIPQDLSQENVQKYLTIIMNLTSNEMKTYDSYGNILMDVTEKLASALVQKNKTISISLHTFELQVITVEPQDFSTNLRLITSHASMDINLTANFNENKGRVAVAFMSYTDMADILKPTFIKTFTDTKKTIISMVVSATLPNATNTNITEPVSFTLKHIKEVAPYHILSCVYWEKHRWVSKDCNITKTNSSHTVCSCNRLGTFALIVQSDPCKDYLSRSCTLGFLYQIPFEIHPDLPQEMVKNYLYVIMNLTTRMIGKVFDQNLLASYGDAVLNVTEQLVSTLVRKRNPSINISLSVQDLDVTIVVAPNISSSKILQLCTQYASVDINFAEISTNNNGSAAVSLMSYTNWEKTLKPTFFKRITRTNKTMMSTVVSASLPKTANTTLTNPLKITFKHFYEFKPKDILSCVYWKTDTWLNAGCSIIKFNITHTECSCDHIATFALILQTDPCSSDHVINTLIAVAIIVGLVFLSLSIVTLSLYSRNPVTNAALINLCINLLLFHFLSLIKTLFLANIQSLQLRAVLAGFQWYFLMSVFVWMFIEAVLLYNFMKNLSNITSISEQVFSWKWLIVIGYLTPLGVLGMSAVRFPDDYIDEECWFVEDENLIFIFAGPVVFTFTLNLVPCLITVIIMIVTLKKLKNEILHTSSSAEKNLIICLMLRSLTQFIILVCYLIFLYIPSKNGALYHAFQFLNSQQGTFIFLIHCLFNQEVRQKCRNVMCVLCFSNNPVGTSRSVRGQAED